MDVINITMDMIMTDLENLLRLQTWLSPAFPIGAFSYSHGLEGAVDAGHLVEPSDLKPWLSDLLCMGAGWNDAVLSSEAWRLSKDGHTLDNLAALATAMSFSAGRHLETTAQGNAFQVASREWCRLDLPENTPLPVVIGAVSGRLDIPLEETLTAYLHAYVSNQIQAALRLMKLGQQAGVRILAGMEECIIVVARHAAVSCLDDLGSCTVLADIAAMQQETVRSRIFRS